MNVVIYTRVSSDEQVQGTSLEFQERICRQFAERGGHSVAMVFTDRGESAKTTDRKEFQSMIRYCRQNRGKVDGILVWKTDRFARNSYDYAVFQGLLAGWNISILSTTESNEDTPHGRAMRMITAVINQLDNDYRAERTKEAMKLLTNYGYWVHMAPIGYIRVRDVEGRPVLIEDPVKAALVRKMFEMIADGCSISSATTIAAKIGLTTRHGIKLKARDVHDMVRNKIYAGLIETKLTDGREVKAKFPALIPAHIWDRVQLVLSGRGRIQKIHERTREEFPLRGFTRCAHCEAKLTGSTSKGRTNRYSYYHCPKCKTLRVSVDQVHEAYRELLRATTTATSGKMKLIRHHVMSIWEERKAAALAVRNVAKTNVTRLETTRAALLDKLLSGTITDEIYREKDSSLALDLASARSHVHDEEIETLDYESALAFAERIASSAAQIWEALDGVKRQRFQQALFPSGLVYDAQKGFRTVDSKGIIGMIHQLAVDKNKMGSHPVITSNQIIEFVSDLNQLARAVAA